MNVIAKKIKQGRPKGSKDKALKSASFEVKNGQLYTVGEIAAWLQRPEPFIRSIIRRGYLSASRVGRGYLIQGCDAVKYFKSMRIRTAAAGVETEQQGGAGPS
jgi:excisionase family DNA binding protein